MELFKIHCGLLPLANRFIVIDWSETRWIIPASVALDFACKYYEEEGWYDDYEVIEEGLTQPHGDELRDCIEVNGDLVQAIKEERWRKVQSFATKIGDSDAVMGDPLDKCWWFEENDGSIEEMTDLPIQNQVPLALLWFDDDYRQAHSKSP